MKRKMDNKELKEFFEEGIVTDLMYAIRHYYIWRTIGENYDQIIRIKDKYFVDFLGELQSNSHDLAIIRLSKIFDRSSNKFQIRCISEILDLELSSTVYFPIHSLDHIEFSQISNFLATHKFPPIIYTPSEFSEIFKQLLNEHFLKEIIEKLKFIRNKTVAHNEHNIFRHGFEGDNFWGEYTTLLYFTKSFMSLFGNIFLSSHYFQFSYSEMNEIHFSILSDLYWLRNQIENQIGEKKFVQWWV